MSDEVNATSEEVSFEETPGRRRPAVAEPLARFDGEAARAAAVIRHKKALLQSKRTPQKAPAKKRRAPRSAPRAEKHKHAAEAPTRIADPLAEYVAQAGLQRRCRNAALGLLGGKASKGVTVQPGLAPLDQVLRPKASGSLSIGQPAGTNCSEGGEWVERPACVADEAIKHKQPLACEASSSSPVLQKRKANPRQPANTGAQQSRSRDCSRPQLPKLSEMRSEERKAVLQALMAKLDGHASQLASSFQQAVRGKSGSGEREPGPGSGAVCNSSGMLDAEAPGQYANWEPDAVFVAPDGLGILSPHCSATRLLSPEQPPLSRRWDSFGPRQSGGPFSAPSRLVHKRCFGNRSDTAGQAGAAAAEAETGLPDLSCELSPDLPHSGRTPAWDLEEPDVCLGMAPPLPSSPGGFALGGSPGLPCCIPASEGSGLDLAWDRMEAGATSSDGPPSWGWERLNIGPAEREAARTYSRWRQEVSFDDEPDIFCKTGARADAQQGLVRGSTDLDALFPSLPVTRDFD